MGLRCSPLCLAAFTLVAAGARAEAADKPLYAFGAAVNGVAGAGTPVGLLGVEGRPPTSPPPSPHSPRCPITRDLRAPRGDARGFEPTASCSQIAKEAAGAHSDSNYREQ